MKQTRKFRIRVNIVCGGAILKQYQRPLEATRYLSRLPRSSLTEASVAVEGDFEHIGSHHLPPAAASAVDWLTWGLGWAWKAALKHENDLAHQASRSGKNAALKSI